MPDPRSSHSVGIWNCVESLFRTLDMKHSGVLKGDDAKLFLDKLLKLKLLELDAEALADLRALVDGEAGITIEAYTAVVLRGEQRQQFELRSKEDGHIVPGRFQQVVGFHDYSVTSQHPCYTTSSRDLGKKKPQVVDMPLRWHGAAGHFTKEFEMNVPGAKAVEVNQYRCRSLNVMQTKSKVHTSLDLPY